MARVWGDEADAAVQVLAVIPTGEGFHPRLCIALVARPLVGHESEFAGSEERFGERVVIADTRAAVGLGYAQLFHRHLHSGTLHRAAVVSVQNQRTYEAALGQHRLSDQSGGQVRTFALMYLPADDFP